MVGGCFLQRDRTCDNAEAGGVPETSGWDRGRGVEGSATRVEAPGPAVCVPELHQALRSPGQAWLLALALKSMQTK